MTMYEEHVLDHYRHPRGKGTLPDADITIEDSNTSCGDRIKVSLKIANGRIAAACQECSGCAISQAGASMLFENLEGKSVQELLALSKEDVLSAFGSTLSVSRVKCALLGCAALKKALIAYETKKGAD